MSKGAGTKHVDIEAVWRDLRQPLLRFIGSRVPDRDTAEDLLQEVILRVHQHAKDVQDTGAVDAWIYRVARNAIIDHYRRAVIRREQPVATTTTIDDESLPWAADEEPETGVRSGLVKCLAPLVEQLPPKYRDALRLTDLGEHSQIETAQLLGMSPSGLKSRVQRGRARLREQLTDCCQIHLDRRGAILDYTPRSGSECTCHSVQHPASMGGQDRPSIIG